MLIMKTTTGGSLAANDDLDDICLNEDISATGKIMSETGNAREVLTRIELCLACCSEKVLNLDMLLMHVSSRLSDYEALDMETCSISSDAIQRAFEFDMLSGILGYEIKELENFMISLQSEIVDAQQIVQPSEHSEIGRKLTGAETSLSQSQEQVAEIRLQSAKFERTLALGRKEICGDFPANGHFSSTNDEWNMQTVEQKRHILLMLEKSLGRELDLEKELSDSRNKGEGKSRLHLLEEEACCIDEPMESIQEKLFGAENAVEILIEISKELMSKLQIVQISLNDSADWENEMRYKLQEEMLRLSTVETALRKLMACCAAHGSLLVQLADSSRDPLQDAVDKYIRGNPESLMLKEEENALEEKLRVSDIQLQQAKDAIEASECRQNMLHSELNEMANMIGNLRENNVKAENRAESAEAKCTVLSKSNLELNEQLCFIRSSLAEKENLLGRKLKESDARLEHAEASAMAIQEQQNLLHDALSDMENLIADLKIKVSNAEIRAEIAESKCTLLIETNLKLNEELCFLRGRLKCLEGSLHQVDEINIATAKDIGNKVELETYLVMKLAFERVCLQAQVPGSKRNKILGEKFWQTKGNVYATSYVDNEYRAEFGFMESFGESAMKTSTTSFQVENSADSDVDATASVAAKTVTTKPNIVRSEEKQLNSKHVLIATLVSVLSVCGLCIFQL